MMINDQKLKETLAAHLNMGKAFMPVDKILKVMSFDKVGIRPDNLPYSFYELFFHIQYAQKDILEYCLNDNYETPSWPEDYWPGESSPANKKEWTDLIDEYLDARDKLRKFALSPGRTLTDRITEDTDHTIFREVLLVIEHSAYHTGQLVLVARLLEEYPKENSG